MLLRSFASSALLGYASTACVMPFEVGKTLMQVQWIPKADVELLNEYDEDELLGNINANHMNQNVVFDADQLSDEDDVQAYFHDLNNSSRAGGNGDDYTSYRSTRPRRNRRQSNPNGHEGPASSAPPMAPSLSVTRAHDDAGYISRRSIFEQATKPEWILPFTVTGGVWDMMKAIGRWKGEGWLSLWKGQLTTFALESLSSLLQPTLYSILVTVFLRDTPFSSLPLVHMPAPIKPLIVTIASHMLTSYLLTPLDLVRTRLIVQSVQSRHKKYSGPVNALRTISDEEGGLASVYTASSLVIPALLDGAVRSFFHLSAPLFIERNLSLTPDSNSIIYGLAEFTLSTFSLLFILPIETVRKRLQVQSRASVVGAKSGKTLKACIETRPTPYSGIAETVYRILTEETGRLHLHNAEQKPRRPSLSSRRSSFQKSQAQMPNMQSRPSSYRAGSRFGVVDEAMEVQREWSSAAQGDASAQTPSVNVNLAPQDALRAQFEAEQENQEPPAPPASYLAGVSQLYRGFSMGLGANLIVLILGLVAGRDDVGSGWTEM